MELTPTFESELALWNIREFVTDKKKFDECIPENFKEGREYNFLLEGQKFFGLFAKFPLVEIGGNSNGMNNTRALINIIEVTHFLDNGKLFTKGKYRILRVVSDK
jgi:hypothetical protein